MVLNDWHACDYVRKYVDVKNRAYLWNFMHGYELYLLTTYKNDKKIAHFVSKKLF